jgi:hypothetical protein
MRLYQNNTVFAARKSTCAQYSLGDRDESATVAGRGRQGGSLRRDSAPFRRGCAAQYRVGSPITVGSEGEVVVMQIYTQR